MTIERTPPLISGRPSTPEALGPKAQPRIFLITVRSGYNGRLARVFAKVPYGHVFNLTEALTRAMVTGEVSWFRLEPARPSQITPTIRAGLQRWPEALRSLSERTGITWLV